MKFMSAVLLVKDMEKSRAFYEKILNQEATIDLGSNVTYGGFSLQTIDSWTGSTDKNKNSVSLSKANDIEICFEASDYDGIVEKVKSHNVELLHDTIEVPWGQRFIRFYDPDKHVIEVGEPLLNVFQKYMYTNMTMGDIIEKTGLSEEQITEIDDYFKLNIV
ncbi:VOC family protein [Methanobrevibacter sp. TMH8]|uniref:VOC family protein n=1 Tax=Methanobrevibacter sp. TMH8 TaxID=2848611 RepID=UPI001CCB5481|nr:VOC family protein [Methanobrevibacter sp. TMH8]MBZ9570920.1 VOC family protein [Methanobrevibacter sp. TMH8]